jgi:hypothetical protein
LNAADSRGAIRATISRLVSFGGRWPGTDAERSAAEYVAGELEATGREAVIEPIAVRPAYPLTHAIHVALAVVGSVVSVYVPPLGVLLLFVAAVSMYGDLTARFHLVRRLMPRRRSQNVTSRGRRPDATARLVVTAHYDAARSGLIFSRRRRPAPRPLRRLATLAGPLDLVFWAIVVGLLLALARMLAGFSEGEATPLTVVQFIDTALLLAAFTLLIDVALSDVVPGANDNGSGVAAALELGRRLEADLPEHLDVWLVFPGAKEGLMLGMREWWRTHEADLDRRRTFFVNLDSVGAGRVRAVGAEGFILISRHDARLVRLADAAAKEVEGDGALAPLTWRLGTDGTIPLVRGFSSITLCATDPYGRVPNHHRQTDTVEGIEPETVERAIEVCERLIRRVDAELIPAILPSLVAADRE